MMLQKSCFRYMIQKFKLVFLKCIFLPLQTAVKLNLHILSSDYVRL